MLYICCHSHQDPISNKIGNLLKSLVGDKEVSTTTFEAGVKSYPSPQLDLAVVVMSPDAERALAYLRQLRLCCKGPILAIGKATDAKLILRALQHGANHYLDQAELENQLGAAVAQFLSTADDDAPSGRLLGVLSVSGGCGASTIAVNMAAALAMEHHCCGLIDLNPGRGDLSALLDLKCAFTLADVCQNEARLDKAMLDKMLVRHVTGISLLGAPAAFSDARSITARGVVKALNLACKFFPHVVVDLEDCFHDEQVATLQQATGILLICRLDFTSLRNARRMLDQLKRLAIPRHRLKLVVNQAGQPNELPVDEAEDALGEKLTRFVPHDPRVIYAANNTGIPAVIKAPQAKVSQSMIQLARIDFEKEAPSSATLQRPVLANV